MSYFIDTAINVLNNTKLRLPQIEAYIKIQEFFEDNPEGEALVVLPTGTGKSGLISIAPYNICNGRVLVITPGLITKKSVIKSLHPLEDNFWLNNDIIFDPEKMPVVEEYDSDMLQDSLERCNFVISNIHNLYEDRAKSLLNRVPNDFFDMVIIDEAHHSVANTWLDVLDYFKSAKKLHLTGTPYRADGELIPGVKIHETSLSEVMALRYVKWLRKMTVNNSEMYFTIPNSPKKLTKDEVLKFKDKEWLERSVALSPTCSNDVIDETISKLMELKSLSPNVPHKILAVACSIAHAKDLLQWYSEKDMSAVIVHSKLDLESLNNNLMAVENNECDVVISVNMLMEGYDHKYLSILGIFRPYRSENAFAQIVGRVLRAIPDNEITDFAIDNNAYIVYHEETGLNKLWDRFQREVQKSKKSILREISISDKQYIRREETIVDIEVDLPYTSTIESYLPNIDFNEMFENARKNLEERIDERIKNSINLQTISSEELKAFREFFRKTELKKTTDEIDSLLISKRPESARKQIREILYKDANNAVQDLLEEKGIDPKGKGLYAKFKNQIPSTIPTGTNNDGVLVAYINNRVRHRYGPVKTRQPEKLLQSQKYMNEVIIELRKMIR